MACRPTFDLNKPHLYSEKRRRNYVITDMYEPGSTFKPITFSGLFEENLVTLEEKVFCEEGMWKVGRRRLRDHKPHGWLTVREVIALSSNIGTAKCARKMTDATFDRYLRKYGFSACTGIDLPGEAHGFLANVRDWSGYSHDSLAMGQEINVTAMQIVTAFSAIANGGELYRPHVLKKVADQDGSVIGKTEKELVRRVISEEACLRLTDAMTEVVETGTAPRVKSKLYMIAGKTGTAQKSPEGMRGYATEKHAFVASFCGFAPVSRPRICVLAVVNEPHGWSHFGGTVAGPIVKEIIEQTLTYMRIPRDRETEDAGTVSQNTQSESTGTAHR
jgi:cell division protein FtsI/penicillin-binding protein 2